VTAGAVLFAGTALTEGVVGFAVVGLTVVGATVVEPPVTGMPLMVVPGAGAGAGRADAGRSPLPVPAALSEPGAKPGCSRAGAVPVPAGRPVGTGVVAAPGPAEPSAPIAGVELAEDGGAPTLGIAGARVPGVCDERPLTVVPLAAVPLSFAVTDLVLEAGGATKA
jgi:hypothetical protein